MFLLPARSLALEVGDVWKCFEVYYEHCVMDDGRQWLVMNAETEKGKRVFYLPFDRRFRMMSLDPYSNKFIHKQVKTHPKKIECVLDKGREVSYKYAKK